MSAPPESSPGAAHEAGDGPSVEERLEAHLLWRQRAGLTRVPGVGPEAPAASAEAAAPARPPRAGSAAPQSRPPVRERAPAPPAATLPRPSDSAPRSQAPGPRPATPPGARPASAPPTSSGSGPLGYTHGLGSDDLQRIRTELGDCQRCGLGRSRSNLVFGVGDPDADLVFVGEGPGAQEDRQGEPFVGRAGELLDKMIAAMGSSRAEVYICNVVKCRPPNNRDPEPPEVAACEPFLKAQLAAIRPKVIVGLGRFAVQSLLGDPQARITRVRGQWASYEGIPLMPTLHPAYLLRNPAAKRQAWEDLQAVMQRLAES